MDIITPPDNDEELLQAELELRTSAEKKEAIKNLTVTNHSVIYAGDDLSQLRMASTIAIANQIFNKKIGQTFTQMSSNPAISEDAQAMFGGVGQLLEAIYKGVYKDNKVDWKGADKKLHMVEIESIAEALLKTMMSVGSEIKKTTGDDG